MRVRKDTLPEQRKRPGKWNKLIIALLSVCLIMTSLPNRYYQTFALAAGLPEDGGQYEVLSISELPEEVKLQNVEIGTPIEALNLPDSLTVSCRRNLSEVQETHTEPEHPQVEDAALDQEKPGDMPSQEDTLEYGELGDTLSQAAELDQEKPEDMLDQEEPEDARAEEAAPEDAPLEETAPEDAPSEGGEEQAEIISDAVLDGITWESAPEYDMEQEGTYIFTPMMPEAYLLSESVVLPEIMVIVEKSEGKIMEALRDFDDESVVLGTEDKRNALESEGEEEASLDKIEKEIFYAEEEKEIYGAGDGEEEIEDDDTETITIAAGQSETWGMRILKNVRVVVEESAVLTITGEILLDGNVTVTGGGTVQRGSAAAYFNVPASGNLTLGNVIVDGGSVSSMESMLKVGSGKLTLDDGCVIQNCTKQGSNGGAISLSQANAVLNKTIIQNCTASNQGGAIYMVGSTVAIHGTKFENCCVGSDASSDKGGALYIFNGCKVDINGATFQRCSARGSGSRSAGGAFYASTGNTIDIRDTLMEENSAGTQGGAFISAGGGNVINIYSGTFRGNSTMSTSDVHGNVGGGCMYNCKGILNIYGGSFLNNYAINKGGAILHCWEQGTTTIITGGIFEGNHCDYKDGKADYSGSGGIFNSSVGNQSAELEISGNVKFCGDGTEGSGVDGIYLDKESGVPRKISISTTLTYPVDLYVKAVEGYIIAEGKGGYSFLHERDMKKIRFIDISDSGKTWYAKLNDDKTQVILTETDPGYKYFVYYISNGATGNVVDDNQYDGDKEAIVKSIQDENGQDILTYEGRTFMGWSRNEDGSGTLYQGGESLGKITEDVNLYAVFAENLAADFYSGSAGSKVRKESVIDADRKGKVEAPELEDLNDPEHTEDMEGWVKEGWAEKEEGFDVTYQPQEEVNLEKYQAYCGIYKKDVTLTYDKNGWDMELAPAADIEPRYARVYDEITYQPAEFTIATDPVYKDFRFVGWNTEPDGSGETYHAGDKVTRESDLTLYAVFEKTVQADFYSGAAGQKETMSAEAGKDGKASIEVPEIKDLEDMDGWEKTGWAKEEEHFAISCQPFEELILEQNAVYCGIYGKNVTLTYDSNGGDSEPESASDTGTRYARVHEDITYLPAEFDIAPDITCGDFAFAGWNTEPDGSGEYYHEGDTLTSEADLTLYAIFTKSFQADFYSGGAGQKETKEAKARLGWTQPIEAPELKDMDGWDKVGWTEDENQYRAEFAAGQELILTKHSSYYGIYRKDIILSYDMNGGEGEQPPMANSCYANVHSEVSYQPAEFSVAEEAARDGYVFVGWNTEADGTGRNYREGQEISLMENQTLYARWVVARADYRVEHYKQELDGSYLLAETENTEAVVGDEVSAKAKAYTGFAENTSHELRKAAGIVAVDGSLVLKLYYDRDIYEVDFDLNGAEGEAPPSQSVPYGDFVHRVEEPVRRGYHFKGWFMDAQGLEENRWDFDMQVEDNYEKAAVDKKEEHEITLYAKWADETAPVLEQISFNRGHVNIVDWIIRKKNLVITVPIFEEGSGVKQLDYFMTAATEDNLQESEEGGTVLYQADESEETGMGLYQADESEEASMGLYQADDKAAAMQQSHEKADGVQAGTVSGTLEIPEGREKRNLLYGVLTPNQGEFAAGKIQLLMKSGQVLAKITVSEDFKGKISLKSTDNAGNVSSEKMITAQEGGLIVEDNAPEIEFSSEDGKLSKTFTHDVIVKVEVMDDMDSRWEDKITGGIASVTYRLDKGVVMSVPKQMFAGDIVDNYKFNVKVSGIGKHILRVTAVDNAGNKNTRRAEVNIAKEAVSPPPQMPTAKTPIGSEPKTGEAINVQVYATLGMVAGLSYLLLYFAFDNTGITEKEKEELVAKLLRWAKRGGIARKLLTFVALFFFLLYYHSIGKSVDVEWKLEDVWQ